LPLAFTLVSCSAYFSTLKMEAICSSEMPVDVQQITWRYIPEDSTLHGFPCSHTIRFLAALLKRRDAVRKRVADVSVPCAGTVTDEVGLVQQQATIICEVY
jgi:hypothetical protein